MATPILRTYFVSNSIQVAISVTLCNASVWIQIYKALKLMQREMIYLDSCDSLSHGSVITHFPFLISNNKIYLRTHSFSSRETEILLSFHCHTQTHTQAGTL